MFVASDARERLEQKRRSVTLEKLLTQLAAEARRLGIAEDELLQLVSQSFQKEV